MSKEEQGSSGSGGGGNGPNPQQSQPPLQIVHVRGDSDSELQALFDTVLSPNSNSSRLRGVPLRLRNLPDSFFNPPTAGRTGAAHSRDLSIDSAAAAEAARQQGRSGTNIT